MDAAKVNSLRRYVTESTRSLQRNGKTIEDDIQDLLEEQTKVKYPLILYRGQLGSVEDSDVITPNTWFSTTKNKAIASLHSHKECCLFMIHIQEGIRILNVHKVLQEHGIGTQAFEEEEEFIVEGGGTFFQDIKKEIPGFLEIGRGEFETYYFPGEKKKHKIPVFADSILRRMEGIENYYNTRNDILSLLQATEMIDEVEMNKVLNSLSSSR